MTDLIKNIIIASDLIYKEKKIYNVDEKLDWKTRHFLLLKNKDYTISNIFTKSPTQSELTFSVNNDIIIKNGDTVIQTYIFNEGESIKSTNESIFKNKNTSIIKIKQTNENDITINLIETVSKNNTLLYKKKIPEDIIKSTEIHILDKKLEGIDNIFQVNKISSLERKIMKQIALNEEMAKKHKQVDTQIKYLLQRDEFNNVLNIKADKNTQLNLINKKTIHDISNIANKINDSYYTQGQINDTISLINIRNTNIENNLENYKNQINDTFYTKEQAIILNNNLNTTDDEIKNDIDIFKKTVQSNYYTKKAAKNDIDAFNTKDKKTNTELIKIKETHYGLLTGLQNRTNALETDNSKIKNNIDTFKTNVASTYYTKNENENNMKTINNDIETRKLEIESLKKYIMNSYYTQIEINNNFTALLESDKNIEKQISDFKTDVKQNYYNKNSINDTLSIINKKHLNIEKNIENLKKKTESTYYTNDKAATINIKVESQHEKLKNDIATMGNVVKTQLNKKIIQNTSQIEILNKNNEGLQKNITNFKNEIDKKYITIEESNKINNKFLTLDSELEIFKNTVDTTYSTQEIFNNTINKLNFASSKTSNDIESLKIYVMDKYYTKYTIDDKLKLFERVETDITSDLNKYKQTVKEQYYDKTSINNTIEILNNTNDDIQNKLKTIKTYNTNTFINKDELNNELAKLNIKNNTLNTEFNSKFDDVKKQIIFYDDKNENEKKFIIGNSNIKKTLNISRGNITFIPYSNNIKDNTGGNNKIIISTNHWQKQGDKKSSSMLYFTHIKKTNQEQINTRMEFNAETGKLHIKGGVNIENNGLGNISTIKKVSFKDINGKPSVYFDSGFYIGNNTVNRDEPVLGGDVIIKNANNIYRPVKITGDISIDKNGATILADDIITSQHIKAKQISNKHVSDNEQDKIAIDKTTLQLGRGLKWLNGNTVINSEVSNLHNYHNKRKTFLCKFPCFGDFYSTDHPPLISKTDIILKEIGPEARHLEMWGVNDNTDYYIFRPWGNDKGLEISNILDKKDFIDLQEKFHTPTFLNYKSWSISLDISMNKDDISSDNNEWVALLNINGIGDADIYLLDGQAYISGDESTGGQRLGDAGKTTINDKYIDVINQKEWTNITFTFNHNNNSGSTRAVEISFYRNGRFIDSHTPDTVVETDKFRLLDKLLLFNEQSNNPLQNAYTGYGWTKNITLYKKSLSQDEVLKLYEEPEKTADDIVEGGETEMIIKNIQQINKLSTKSINQEKEIKDMDILIKNLQNTIVELTREINALKVPS